MNDENQIPIRSIKKSTTLSDTKIFSINLAIVGGGRACRSFLEFLFTNPFPSLEINISGVCDIIPEAEGLILAKKMGIYTTNSINDLFKIQGLDSILELTGSQEVLLDIIRLRPKKVGILENNISRIFRNVFDMDKRLKSTEQELIAEKMLSSFLIQQSTAAIVILNTDFTIVDSNDAYLKAVKKSKEQVIGAHCYKISHSVNVPCSSAFPGVKCPMVETLRTGKNVNVIHDHPGLDGKLTYCNLTTYPIKNDAGDIIQIIEFWRDITDEFSDRYDKRIREFQSDIQKLIQEDRMISLGKLAASCAHEINNPIQGLITFTYYMLDILNEGKPSPENLEDFKSHLSLMSTELERCGNIISGLLSFSRESSVEYRNIDINEVINSVLSLTRHKMKLKNIQLIPRLFARPLILEGDVNQLQQCFLNLIFNAIEAMPKVGQLTVISELDTSGKYIKIQIRDTGYGIPEKNKDNLFDPFFTTKEPGQGTGLGLSIVYGIIKNHKGTIKIDSKVGHGTIFILKFPIL